MNVWLIVIFLAWATDALSKPFVSFDISMRGSLERTPLGKHNIKLVTFVKKLYNKNHYAIVKPLKAPTIPNAIHQIWVGPRALPVYYETIKQSWVQHNPGWKYTLWREDDLKPLIDQLPEAAKTLYYKTHDSVEKANIARYAILFFEGGVYADIDCRCLKSFAILNKTYDFYAGIEPLDTGHIINNAIIGCSPGNSIMKHCIESIKNNVRKKHRFLRTGIVHFGTSFYEAMKTFKGRAIIFPASYFFPFGYKQTSSWRRYIRPESFAVHYWNSKYSDKIQNIIKKSPLLKKRLH